LSAATPVSAKKLSVLLIADATADRVSATHRETREQLQSLDLDLEFIYLLASADAAILEEIKQVRDDESFPVRVLQFAMPVTTASMIVAGAQSAEGDLLLILPACAEASPDVLPELCAAVLSGTDLAFASRNARTPALSGIQSRAFNWVVSLATGSHFSDIACRTRATRPELLRELNLYGDFDRYLPLLAQRAGFSVAEIQTAEHPEASSKVLHSPLSYLWRLMDVLSVMFINRFTRYPLRLFGGIGSLFAGVGGLLLALIGFQRIFLDVPAADRPLLVLGTLLLGLGVQGFAIGLLGELLLFFNSRGQRDYRVEAIHESSPPALTPRSD
jgi:hypothetical protein